MSSVELVLRSWGFAILGASLVAVAFLVNRFAAAKRRRLRRALLLYGVYLVAFSAWHVLAHLRSPAIVSWAEHVGLVRDVFGAFTFVSLSALIVFDLFLPAVGFRLVAITSDIVVGFAYIFASRHRRSLRRLPS
jgi:hypothetical protein